MTADHEDRFDLGQHLIDRHGVDVAQPGGWPDEKRKAEHDVMHAIGGWSHGHAEGGRALMNMDIGGPSYVDELQQLVLDLADYAGLYLDPPHDPAEWHDERTVKLCMVCRVNGIVPEFVRRAHIGSSDDAADERSDGQT